MNIQNLVLDINKKCNQIVTANVGEVGSRFLKINIIDNGMPVDLTGVTVYLYAKKADDTKVFNTVKVEDAKQGIVLVEITSQVLAIEGLIKLTLLLVKDNARLATKIFNLKVDETIIDDEAIESANEFGALTESLSKLGEWNSYFEETSGKIEEKYTERLNQVDSQLEHIQNKQKISITDFNSKGDGVTDNTENFKEAINKAEEEGTTIVIPYGEFFTNELQVNKGITIEGFGWSGGFDDVVGSVIKCDGRLFNIFGNGSNNRCEGFTLRNIAIKCKAKDLETILIKDAGRFSFENVLIQIEEKENSNTENYGIRVLGGSNMGTYRNYFKNVHLPNAVNGIQLKGVDDTVNNTHFIFTDIFADKTAISLKNDSDYDMNVITINECCLQKKEREGNFLEILGNSKLIDCVTISNTRFENFNLNPGEKDIIKVENSSRVMLLNNSIFSEKVNIVDDNNCISVLFPQPFGPGNWDGKSLIRNLDTDNLRINSNISLLDSEGAYKLRLTNGTILDALLQQNNMICLNSNTKIGFNHNGTTKATINDSLLQLYSGLNINLSDGDIVVNGYGGKGSVQAKQFKVGDNVVIRERQNAISNLTSTDTTQTIVAKVNAILAMLRTHGLIEKS